MKNMVEQSIVFFYQGLFLIQVSVSNHIWNITISILTYVEVKYYVHPTSLNPSTNVKRVLLKKGLELKLGTGQEFFG